MRWWALIGTALTLGLSLGMFFNFRYDTVESHGYNTPEAREWATLPTRAETADTTPHSDPKRAATGSPATRGFRISTSTISSAPTASAWPWCC